MAHAIGVTLDLGRAVLDILFERSACGDTLLEVELQLAAELFDAIGFALAHLATGRAARLGASKRGEADQAGDQRNARHRRSILEIFGGLEDLGDEVAAQPDQRGSLADVDDVDA